MPASTESTVSSEEERLFADAVAVANVPSLLPMLVQLTGDRRWLEEPYRVTRARGLGDNDTGGLPESVQQEIRDAALDAILAWRAGRPAALEDVSPELGVEMLAWVVAEKVPDEYAPIIQVELPAAQSRVPDPVEVPEGFQVLVIGAGVSGMGAAIRLKQLGIPFTIVEKGTQVGGTWRDNRYPGAGVDTPNHLYSYSFVPYDWSMYYCLRDELEEYLEHVAEKFALRPSIEFETTVESCEYDTQNREWIVKVQRADGTHAVKRANAVISAVGIFNPLVKPDIPGLESFEGPCFHTAEWPDDVEVEGKRVAIIGNGASAMQTGPAIQHDVEALTIFQRSPHWVAPNEHFGKKIPEPIRFLLREVPYYRAWYRMRVGWTVGDRMHKTLQKDDSWPHPERSLNRINDAHRAYFTEYLDSELGDRSDLRDKVLPTFPPLGKRLLMDNGWFRMLRNPKVTLVDEAVTEVRSDRVVTADGTEYEADVLVLATGFDVLRFINAYEVHGRSGRSLREVWDDIDARAYLGTVIPDFPNFFVIYGPNLQPGHGGSYMFTAELQTRYIMSVLTQMFEENLAAVECRQDVHDEYNERVDALHERMVWTHPGMSTYYRNERGRVVVNSPFRNAQFFAMTHKANLSDFETEPRTES
jgi:4-hydroxyacetophenone monooxygenase